MNKYIMEQSLIPVEYPSMNAVFKITQLLKDGTLDKTFYVKRFIDNWEAYNSSETLSNICYILGLLECVDANVIDNSEPNNSGALYGFVFNKENTKFILKFSICQSIEEAIDTRDSIALENKLDINACTIYIYTINYNPNAIDNIINNMYEINIFKNNQPEISIYPISGNSSFTCSIESIKNNESNNEVDINE